MELIEQLFSVVIQITQVDDHKNKKYLQLLMQIPTNTQRINFI